MLNLIGFEKTDKEEFFVFLNWYKENYGAYAESDFDDKKQFKNKDLSRIAYYFVNRDNYMIAEDLYTEFYHNHNDK